VYKCPFCKLRFSNDECVKDLKDLVIHCGSQHGFAVFYLISDKHIEDTRNIVIQGMMNENIKEEPEVKKIKVEPEVVVNVKQENYKWETNADNDESEEIRIKVEPEENYPDLPNPGHDLLSTTADSSPDNI